MFWNKYWSPQYLQFKPLSLSLSQVAVCVAADVCVFVGGQQVADGLAMRVHTHIHVRPSDVGSAALLSAR